VLARHGETPRRADRKNMSGVTKWLVTPQKQSPPFEVHMSVVTAIISRAHQLAQLQTITTTSKRNTDLVQLDNVDFITFLLVESPRAKEESWAELGTESLETLTFNNR
jgi:hypothetical protein